MLCTLYWNNKDSVDLVAQKALSGAVFAGSTDTVIGLMAMVSLDGFNNLNRIKRRENKNFIILIESVDRVQCYVNAHCNLHLENIMKNCWPGPVTLIMKMRDDAPSFLPGKTVALRVPAHPGLQRILHHCDLFSTSANIPGEQTPETVEDLDPHIVQSVSAIIDDAEHHANKLPSTILDCTENEVRLIRQGAYSVDELERIYGAKIVR